jgi:DNA-binding NarL/FixJ family response regulator
LRNPLLLVVQPDPALSSRIERELARTGVRIAGPVDDLGKALARAEQQVVAAVLLDLHVEDGTAKGTVARFRARHPQLPVVVTASRDAEAEARRAVADAGALLYLLHDEIGRGLLAPVVRHLAGMPEQDGAVLESPLARRLLHDLGNLLSVVNGESEMLVDRAADEDPLTGDLRDLHGAIRECVRVFRELVAARKGERPGTGPDA